MNVPYDIKIPMGEQKKGWRSKNKKVKIWKKYESKQVYRGGRILKFSKDLEEILNPPQPTRESKKAVGMNIGPLFTGTADIL